MQNSMNRALKLGLAVFFSCLLAIVLIVRAQRDSGTIANKAISNSKNEPVQSSHVKPADDNQVKLGLGTARASFESKNEGSPKGTDINVSKVSYFSCFQCHSVPTEGESSNVETASRYASERLEKSLSLDVNQRNTIKSTLLLYYSVAHSVAQSSQSKSRKQALMGESYQTLELSLKMILSPDQLGTFQSLKAGTCARTVE